MSVKILEITWNNTDKQSFNLAIGGKFRNLATFKYS